MDVTEKFEEFLKSKDEGYLLSLKNHFSERLQITFNEEGKFTGLKPDEMNEQLTIEFYIDLFAEIPDGFSKFLYLVDESIEPISEMILYFLSEYFVKQFDRSFFEELKNELDIGSNEALLVLTNKVYRKIETLISGDIPLEYKHFQMIQNILCNINGNTFKLLMQAILSIHLGFFGSAKMQIQHALKVFLNKLATYDFQHGVVEKYAVKKKAQDSAKKGSSERWKLERKVKKEAFIKLNEMKKSGKFKNNSQASKDLTDSLCHYAKNLGCPFTDNFSAQRRLYDWFRSESKILSKMN